MRKHVLLAALLLAGATVTAGPVSAAGLPQSRMPGVIAGDGLLEPVQWGWRRCRYWRRECAERWGWGGWRFRRCLWRHGCFFGGGRDHYDDHRGRGRDRDDDDYGDRGRRGGRDRDDD